MLLEALVATTCIVGQNGCSEATSAYYKSNKELQQTVQNIEKIGKHILDDNQYIVYVATPAYAFLSGQPASFKLHRALILRVDIKQTAVGLQWNY